MLKTTIKLADGSYSHDASVEAITAAVNDPAALLWLDMFQPTEQEYALLDSVFHFHPLAIEDSIKYSQRPKLENYSRADGSHYIYMVFHVPDLETFKQKLRTKEVDFFASERYLVTCHDEKIRSIDALEARCTSAPEITLEGGADMLLHGLLDRMVDAYQPILDHLGEELDALEEEALNSPEPSVLGKIASTKRDLLGLRRIVGPQREVVAQLTRGEVTFIRESVRLYLRDVQDHLIRMVEMVELYRDLILGARDIYMSSVSNRLNQVMKTLTIISVVGLPMTIVTGFFGMNFDTLPGIHTPAVFWGAVVFMLIVVVGMLTLFKVKRWL